MGGDLQLSALQDAFPQWRIWRSTRDDGSPGAWYATRIRGITLAQERAGAHATVAQDTLPALLGTLTEQAAIFNSFA